MNAETVKPAEKSNPESEAVLPPHKTQNGDTMGQDAHMIRMREEVIDIAADKLTRGERERFMRAFRIYEDELVDYVYAAAVSAIEQSTPEVPR